MPTVDTLVAQHSFENCGCRALDGRRLHHQRDPAADRPDDHSPRHQSVRRRARKATLADAFAVAVAAHGRDAQLAYSCPPPRGVDLWNAFTILKMGSLLLVTIQVDMHDELAMTLQEDLTNRVVKDRRARSFDRYIGPGGCRFFIGRMIANYRRHGAHVGR